jgi:hypothetical protein
MEGLLLAHCGHCIHWTLDGVLSGRVTGPLGHVEGYQRPDRDLPIEHKLGPKPD